MPVKHWKYILDFLHHAAALAHGTFSLQAASWRKFILKIDPAKCDGFYDVQLIDTPLAVPVG